MPSSVQVRHWDAKNTPVNQLPKDPALCTTTSAQDHTSPRGNKPARSREGLREQEYGKQHDCQSPNQN
jgi:hypothetical protein